MEAQRFFTEVDQEAMELDEVNAELQYIGQENIEAQIDANYSAFIQEMFAEIEVMADLYNQDYRSEWDDEPTTVTGCDPAEYNDGWYDEQYELETL